MDAVEAIAAELGITLLTEGEMRARAAAAVERISGHLDDLLSTGQMRDLNRQYRVARLAAGARGERFPPYARWLSNERAKMIARLAPVVQSAETLPAELPVTVASDLSA